MAREDEAITFLLHCIKHANHGKVDFGEIAREFGAVSKGAAAKRYERLMRSHGPHTHGRSTDRATSLSPTKEKSNSEIAKAAEAKKRKLEADHPNAFRRDQGKDSRSKNSSVNFHEAPPFIKSEPTLFGYRSMMHSPMPPPPPPMFFTYPTHVHPMNGPSNFCPPPPYVSSNDAFQAPGHAQMQSAFPSSSNICTPPNPALQTAIHTPAPVFGSDFKPPVFTPSVTNSDKNMMWDQAQSLATTNIDDKSCIPRIDEFWNTESTQGDLSDTLGSSLRPVEQSQTVPLPAQEVVAPAVESVNIAQVKHEPDDDCIVISD